MKTRYFDHIDLRVRDMKRAQRFYEQVLPALGFTRETGDEEWGSFTAPGDGKREFFGSPKTRTIDRTERAFPSGQIGARKWTEWRQWCGAPAARCWKVRKRVSTTRRT
jgi:catechol 2,3-dioxygenase-like lactoylglutathione lyase family enzyme